MGGSNIKAVQYFDSFIDEELGSELPDDRAIVAVM
jgi:hypothetical protein